MDDAETVETVAARSTRDALMDAALDILSERGVLAGLNLREVADRVGVTAANIYHLFGSRQGLLRAALTRELEHIHQALIEAQPLSFAETRLHMYDVIGERPRLALTALLALDEDPDYHPFPFIDTTRLRYEAEIEAGELPGGIDIEAVHVFSLSAVIAHAIYGTAAARQLGVTPESLRARMRVMLERSLDALLADPDPS
jgi:AcrR family transcriptional regulator